jgi:hypothetical protein
LKSQRRSRIDCAAHFQGGHDETMSSVLPMSSYRALSVEVDLHFCRRGDEEKNQLEKITL